MADTKKHGVVTLKKIPPETFGFLLDKQTDMKKDLGVGQYSIEKTIYKLLDDHMKITGWRPKPQRV